MRPYQARDLPTARTYSSAQDVYKARLRQSSSDMPARAARTSSRSAIAGPWHPLQQVDWQPSRMLTLRRHFAP